MELTQSDSSYSPDKIRKKQYFSNYKRLIIDFELTETPEQFDLSVVSVPIP